MSTTSGHPSRGRAPREKAQVGRGCGEASVPPSLKCIAVGRRGRDGEAVWRSPGDAQGLGDLGVSSCKTLWVHSLGTREPKAEGEEPLKWKVPGGGVGEGKSLRVGVCAGAIWGSSSGWEIWGWSRSRPALSIEQVSRMKGADPAAPWSGCWEIWAGSSASSFGRLQSRDHLDLCLVVGSDGKARR